MKSSQRKIIIFSTQFGSRLDLGLALRIEYAHIISIIKTSRCAITSTLVSIVIASRAVVCMQQRKKLRIIGLREDRIDRDKIVPPIYRQKFPNNIYGWSKMILVLFGVLKSLGFDTTVQTISWIGETAQIQYRLFHHRRNQSYRFQRAHRW